MSNIKAKVAQVTPIVTAETAQDYARMNKLGGLFTADWKFQLAAAGLVWTATLGTVSTGADMTLIVGGGNGTTIDNDQPEMVVGVDAGSYLIPISANFSAGVDSDADGELARMVLFADRTQAPPTTNASGTATTPLNALDGGGAFPGRCWTGSTGDITDPVCSEILAVQVSVASDNGTAANNYQFGLNINKEWTYPKPIAGPCQIVLEYGGTGAASGAGVIEFACVPASYFPVT